MQLDTNFPEWGTHTLVTDDSGKQVGFIDTYRKSGRSYAFTLPTLKETCVTSVYAGIALLLGIDILDIPHDIG